jgi:glycosyltransferase involved in cell wall biosynthesis
MSKPLRLLHVAPLPPPWSGIGVSFQHFIASAPLRAQSNWVINSTGSAARSARQKLPTPRRIARHARLTAQIIRIARERRVQLVHLHGSSHDLSFVANGLTLASLRMLGVQTVWQLHDDLAIVLFPGRSWLTQRTFAGLAPAGSKLLVLTDKDRAVGARFAADHRVSVLPPTCSTEMLSIPLDRGDHPPRVLYVGWLSEAKGIYDLLRVAALVRNRVKHVQFDVLGVARSEEQAREVRKYIASNDLSETVKLAGLMTGSEKRARFAAAHVLFTPTHQDAFPVSVLEAMSAGLPVVGTHVGGLPFMLEEGSGARLLPVGAVEAMADHLVELLVDRDVRRRMGAANRERFLGQFHPDQTGAAAVKLYQMLTGNNGRASRS